MKFPQVLPSTHNLSVMPSPSILGDGFISSFTEENGWYQQICFLSPKRTCWFASIWTPSFSFILHWKKRCLILAPSTSQRSCSIICIPVTPSFLSPSIICFLSPSWIDTVLENNLCLLTPLCYFPCTTQLIALRLLQHYRSPLENVFNKVTSSVWVAKPSSKLLVFILLNLSELLLDSLCVLL